MQLRWGWAVLAVLALCAGLIWWTQPAVVYRILQSHPDHVLRQPKQRADAGPTLYRWIDAGGVVNITTNKPPAGRHYTIVQIDPNQNVVPMSDDSTQKPATKRR